MRNTKETKARERVERAASESMSHTVGAKYSKTILRVNRFSLFNGWRKGLKMQDGSKTQSCLEAEVRCLSASVDNLLRLFSIHATQKR
jgi:hypothetical protein